ncbi:MAG: hypothetical protein AB7S38_28800 [Vulcanimicrobiota bacterium]
MANRKPPAYPVERQVVVRCSYCGKTTKTAGTDYAARKLAHADGWGVNYTWRVVACRECSPAAERQLKEESDRAKATLLAKRRREAEDGGGCP